MVRIFCYKLFDLFMRLFSLKAPGEFLSESYIGLTVF